MGAKGYLLADKKPATSMSIVSPSGEILPAHEHYSRGKTRRMGQPEIRPHENIIPRAKSDRMSMLTTCQANTSQVMAM